jgi:hypothetical protein
MLVVPREFKTSNFYLARLLIIALHECTIGSTEPLEPATTQVPRYEATEESKVHPVLAAFCSEL